MIYGEGVRLRAVERSDIHAFLRWFNDPEIRRYLLMFQPLSEAQEERWFERQLTSGDQVYGIEIPWEGGWRLIGNCGLHDIDWKNRSAVLGIVIGEKDCWGQGHGTAAVLALVGYAFQELNLHRVMLDVYDFNPRAIRAYEKAGFCLEGIKRQAIFRDGTYHDVHLMAILNHQRC